MPDVSVIVTTHNVADWLDECLSSILSDQPVDIEVIVVDSGSTDGTRAVGSAWATGDERVRMIDAKLRNGSHPRSYGIELARAPYIALCNGFDLIPSSAYDIMLRSARVNAADMVVGDILRFSSTRTWSPTVGSAIFNEPKTGIAITDIPALIRHRACGNRIIRREFLLERQICFPDAPEYADIAPMTSALLEARKINIVPDVVYLDRELPNDPLRKKEGSWVEDLSSYLQQEYQCLSLLIDYKHPSVTQALRQVMLERILQALTCGSDARTDSEIISQLCRLGPELVGSSDINAFNPRKRHILAALRLASPIRLLQALAGSQPQETVRGLALKVNGHVAQLEGECPTGIRPDACTVVIIRADDPAFAVEVGLACATPGGAAHWCFELEKEAIPANGGWLVSLEFDDGAGLQRVPVLISRSAISTSTKPWHHLAVAQVESPDPVHLNIFKRGSLIRRGTAKIARSVRRRLSLSVNP